MLGGFFAAAAYTTIKKIKDIYDSRIIVLSFVGVGTLFPLVLFILAPYVDTPEYLRFLFPEFILPTSLNIWFLIGLWLLSLLFLSGFLQRLTVVRT